MPASVLGVELGRELRNDVLAGDITLSVRLWRRPQVKQGGLADDETPWRRPEGGQRRGREDRAVVPEEVLNACEG